MFLLLLEELLASLLALFSSKDLGLFLLHELSLLFLHFLLLLSHLSLSRSLLFFLQYFILCSFLNMENLLSTLNHRVLKEGVRNDLVEDTLGVVGDFI